MHDNNNEKRSGYLGEPMLVRNEGADDHERAIKDVLVNATEISVAVAFLKVKGLKRLKADLRDRLESGAKIEMFIGRDFCLTEPEALRLLLNDQKEHKNLVVYLAKSKAATTFHPKIYYGSGPVGALVLIGSANLTGAALTSNEEISLACPLEAGSRLTTQIDNLFATYRHSSEFEELDAVVLEQYERTFNVTQEIRRRIERENASDGAEMFDLASLASLHQEFMQSAREVEALEKRRQNRRRAKNVQNKIADMEPVKFLSKQQHAEFEVLFKNLITSKGGHLHLWHSGDIHRRGQAALEVPKKAIALFALAKAAAAEGLPPGEAYVRLREAAVGVKGAGINMVTEILCTFAPKKYAVFNGNTAAALRFIGANPPKSIRLFSPETYTKICEVMEALQRRIGSKDFSDVDAFLNWIYHKKLQKKKLAEKRRRGV